MILKRIPTEDDLARIYYEMASIGARCAGDRCDWPYSDMDRYSLLALAAEMSRFDPRLFGIIVEYFIDQWKEINPAKIRTSFDLMETPQIFGVVCEFLKKAGIDPEVIPYSTYLTSGLKPVPMQFFFHGLYNVGGPLAKRAAEFGLAEYKKWGFLASERPAIDSRSKKGVGTLDKTSRINILKTLLNRKNKIKISDYLRALENSISRQQALIDLNRCSFAEKTGRGRGAYWKLAALDLP